MTLGQYLEIYLKETNRFISRIDNKFLIFTSNLVNCYLIIDNDIVSFIINDDFVTKFRLTICDVFNKWLIDTHLVIIDLLKSIKLHRIHDLIYDNKVFIIINKKTRENVVSIEFGENIKLSEYKYNAKRDYRKYSKIYIYDSNILYDFRSLLSII